MARRNIPLGHIPMEPGERRWQVTVQQLAESQDAVGFPIEDWSTLALVFMSKRESKGDERFAAAQLSGRSIVYWEAAYRADCDPDLVNVVKRRRLVYQGRVHDIVDASQIGSRDGIEFVTQAQVR